jgi:metal-responsive CopG/Arc/MetJ family transcriptional regulator
MKGNTITVRLDDDLLPMLDEVRKGSGQTRSEVIREALKRHLARRHFEQLRRRAMPFAEARGYLTDEDVFKVVS